MKPIAGAIFATGMVMLAAPGALAAVQGDWSGSFIGAKAGVNQVSGDGISSENALDLGLYGGYQMQYSEHFVFGGDVFYDWNQKKDHSTTGPLPRTVHFGTNVYGLDLLAGFPLGTYSNWMPYAKVGYGWANGTGDLSGSDNAMRYGAGIAWKLSRGFSMNVQYMHQNFDTLQNNNWTVGATWHFVGY